MRGVRLMLAAGLVAGAVGLSACGDDDEDAASDAAASIQSQVSDVQGSAQDQVDSALSQAGDVQSQVQDQVDSALSQAESAAGDATSAASEATAEDTAADTAAAGGGDAAAGKEVFNSAGCAGCHTLADAGAAGAVGPNLDEVKPSADTVVQFVTNGASPMPSFAGQLSETDIANVAAYVSSVAGS